MNHPDHICRFNDGPQTCDCYDAGYHTGRQAGLKEAEAQINKVVYLAMLPSGHVANRIASAIKALL